MLEDLNLLLEQLRVHWRLCHDRRWISQQQLVFVVGKLDEAGRMTGGWLKQLSTRPAHLLEICKKSRRFAAEDKRVKGTKTRGKPPPA